MVILRDAMTSAIESLSCGDPAAGNNSRIGSDGQAQTRQAMGCSTDERRRIPGGTPAYNRSRPVPLPGSVVERQREGNSDGPFPPLAILADRPDGLEPEGFPLKPGRHLR